MNMNSHFKKNRKGNTGKIGVWDIKNSKYDVLLTGTWNIPL